MTTIHELLDEYTALAANTRTKGFLFEKLVQKFLLTDPLYAGVYEDVWLWQEWPGREGKPDTGIDLVARERYTGALCAIQCKFYAPTHYLQKSDIDSFFTASGKEGFNSRVIVSTTDKWSAHAEEALRNQQIPTTRLGTDDLANSEIDWSTYSLTNPDSIEVLRQKALRPHQIEALRDVVVGFDSHERGKLIMACGTGKTFTSLRIAEALVQPGGSVLFLVPSIALLSQSLKEWTAQSANAIRAFAICSDGKVGKNSEDYSVSDLAFPATTNSEKLLAEITRGSNPDGLTVYFSTYQSIQVVSDAQASGLAHFDLVICDEAHRTTGVTLAPGDESNFVRVHDDTVIHADRRLYMTATPKIYGDGVKAKAKDASAVLSSMDDETLFGPEFHRLGFGTAVERNLLTDYKVLVLAVSEEAVTAEFQQQFQHEGELNLDDAARIKGIYNALGKRGVEGLGPWPADRAPMRRAVAFSRSIKDSQKVSNLLDLNSSIPLALKDPNNPLVLESRHVDGTMNVLERNSHLDWLKAETEGNVARILTNARCLSEGVDVPALDAVIFLNSRDSQIDVVQSVGRVMRLSPEKDYGYIILPIAVPAGVDPVQALNDNAKYKVVWDVLRALRSHDERFEAEIEQLDLNNKSGERVQVIGGDGYGHVDEDGEWTQTPLDLSAIQDVQEAIYAKIVEKVGERLYWENWATNVADVAAKHTLRIGALIDTDETVRAGFDRFVKGLQDNLNPSVTSQDALDMLSQHLITQPVLDALFEDFDFAGHNPVATAMQSMLSLLQGSNLESETAELESFYESVRVNVRGITDAAGKQTFLKMLYQRFFSVALRKASERLGIVYTPNEIVDFILHSVEHVLRTEFDSSLSAEGVHVLDPFTGTGTFIARLMQSGLISDADLPRKFRHELHANEINLLAYYVAAVNIEEVYHSRMGGDYVPFDNILLTDTFQMTEDDDELDATGVFEANNAGVVKQNALPITVIVGNPPYSAGQDSANDNNANLKYKTLDKRIEQTYARLSTAQNKNSLYDSYIRAIRWASDRIGDRGVVGYVSNGGFIDGNTADGLRKTLVEEFSSLYVFNLRGNTRTSGEQARKEGGQTFGPASRATIAISILIKNPDAPEHGKLYYRDIGDYLTTAEKLGILAEQADISAVPWTHLSPNAEGDWSSQRDSTFLKFREIGNKGQSANGFFQSYSSGLKTNRDVWTYSSSKAAVELNVKSMIDFYNEQVALFANSGRSADEVDAVINFDETRISWNRADKSRVARGIRHSFDAERAQPATYRPFNKQAVYFDRKLNDMVYKLESVFPSPGLGSHGFYYVGRGSAVPFSVLATNLIPDLHVTGAGSGGQYFPRYTYEPRGEQPSLFDEEPFTRVDNITDEILMEYRASFGASVSKDDIFYYVYGILHSPEYREEYAADLKKMLPRIPKVKGFWEFATAGKRLSDLHIGYESVSQYPLDEVSTGATTDLRVTKMRFAGKRPNIDKSTIVYNENLTLTGIPDEAHEYMLGSRSAIEWILERYQVKKDKASGIVNDPNDWGLEHDNPRYILDLLKSIVTVSVETVRIVKGLPSLDLVE
ncbi:DEAD/DEAH box helicase [Lacisediminihabitans sp.]|jgi:predicted helicase|uniref:DEAD/DEAH box helicase n=1 Tax=Lacisediminihabitans sp. TaxID=2787631 RepID=UPI002F945975